MRKRRTVGDRVDRLHNNPPTAIEIDDAPAPPIPFERPLDKPEMAAVLGVTVSGLDKLIASGKAPPFFRAGRLLRWRPSVARNWIANQERAAAKEQAVSEK